MALRKALEREVEGEVRFDPITRALYATDASVYQIEPLGVVLPRSRDDLVRVVRICARLRCPLTMRGGGTSQAGQAIGAGLIVDTSKYLNAVLELNAVERWVRVEPGIVLDELNAQLRPHGLRFAPDVSTASRATIGGMMANNSSGARSVLYGKTIDHVLEQEVVLSDGSVVQFGPLAPEELPGAGSRRHARRRVLQRRSRSSSTSTGTRSSAGIRRCCAGWAATTSTSSWTPHRPFNLAKLMVGSEGTLGVVLSAEAEPRAAAEGQGRPHHSVRQPVRIARRHAARSCATAPSAVEVMDRFILDHTRQSPALHALRQSFIDGDPASLLCVEFYGDRPEDVASAPAGARARPA